MADYARFDQEKIDAALETARRHNELVGLSKVHSGMDVHSGGEFSITAGCISVTVKDGKICIELPLGFGKYCLPIPPWIPDGAEVKACLDICTTWGIPTGVKLTVSFNGLVIFTKTFGKC